MLFLVVACARHHDTITLQPDAARAAASHSVLVATSRRAESSARFFGTARAAGLNFARFTVSVPPERPAGAVTWPSRPPGDPTRHFLTVSAERMSGPAFLAAVDEGLRGRRNREAIVFVHGYNSTFAEGLYRQAQIQHDFGLLALPIHYSWPSAGTLIDYPYDVESAIFSAEGLADLLEALSRTDIRRIVLVGHSMGSLVVTEAVRLLSLRGSDSALGRLHAVVFLSPDIDIDIFRQRVAGLEGQGLPFFVFTSRRDGALQASSALHGRRVRLGALTDPGPVSDLPVHLIDITGVRGADPLQHNTVATSPLMIALLRGLDAEGSDMVADFSRRSAGLAELTAHTVRRATLVLVDPVAGP